MHRRDLLRLVSLSVLAGAAGCDGRSASCPEAFSPEAAPDTGFVPDVEMVLTAAPDEVSVLPGAPTRVWRFTGRLLKGPADTLHTLPGSYLGPVIRLRRGQHALCSPEKPFACRSHSHIIRACTSTTVISSNTKTWG
jgi:FtsP/CotA-like multicopper oxidase with cupredoxin domain